jgi:hypothetical protein
MVQFYHEINPCLSLDDNVTYPANNPRTPSTASYHIPGTIANLPRSVPISTSFHKIPIRSPRSVSESVFEIQLHILVLTVQSRGDELGAELEEVDAYLAASIGQRIEAVQVDVRCY